MKKKIVWAFCFTFIKILPITATEDALQWQSVFDLIAPEDSAQMTFRAPTPPSSLGASLGSVQFKGYNGSTIVFGSAINGYYGIVGSGLPDPNATMPGNIGVSTVPTISVANNLTARLLISALGRIGIGNFVPGTGTNNGLPNALLNIEGDNTATANSALHVGSRVTAIDPLVSGTAYSTQIDGRSFGAGLSTFVNQLNVTDALALVDTRFIHATDIPLTISTPGWYCFAENISTTTATAITVTAGGEGAIIDFNDYMLTGTGAATTGILLNNTSDVTIKNGNISGYANGTSISTTGANNARITIDNMYLQGFEVALDSSGTTTANDGWVVNNCQFSGGISDTTLTNAPVLNVAKMTNCLFSDCVVTNCIDSGAGIGAIRLFAIDGCDNLVIRDCIISDSENNVGPISGFDFRNTASTNVVFENCDVSNLTSTTEVRCYRCNIGASNFYGINCTSSNNSSGASCNVFGQDGGTTMRGVWKNCIAGGSVAGDLSFGYFFDEGMVCAEDCIAFNISSLDTITETAVGFSVSGSLATLNRCIAFHQTAAASGLSQAIGIRIRATNAARDDSLVTGCIAFGQETGIRITTAGQNTINQILENISTRNTNNYSQFPAGATQTAAGIAGINASLTIPLINVSVT